MFGLRIKILVGFGGLLLVTAAVSILAERVFDRYGVLLAQSMRDDYQSVVLCSHLKNAAETMEEICREAIDDPATTVPPRLALLQQQFQANLAEQRIATTLPGEREATDRLDTTWRSFPATCRKLWSAGSFAQRRDYFNTVIHPVALQIENQAQAIAELNLDSLKTIHGRASSMAVRARAAMRLLAVCGLALAVLFSFFVGRLILAPIKLLTQSARAIENGNLNLQLNIRSRDELGSLARAFNSMAGQLLVYRQRDADRLIRTEHATQVAIDSLPDAVAIIRQGGFIELTNRAAKQWFQLNPGIDIEGVAIPWLSKLYHEGMRTNRHLALEGYESIVEADVDGETRFFLPRLIPIHDNPDRVVGATLTLVDVTGLRRLDEMKNGMLSLVSHELKTPLTSIRMLVHLLSAGKVGDLTDRQRELLKIVCDDSDRLHQIVESLLDMGRIQAGKAIMELRPALPAKLVAPVVESFMPSFQSQQTALLTDVPDDLPLVLADATRVGYVISNLLGNSLRHTSAGGHVWLHARPLDDCVEFLVTDDGEGIPAPYVHRVFEKFFRAPGQTNSSGSGLGLSIAREIIEAHGGQIRVKSAPGAGATIAFTLKLHRPTTEKNTAAPPNALPVELPQQA